MISDRRRSVLARWMLLILLVAGARTVCADAPAISPSAYWKNEIAFPYDAFCNRGTARESVKWIKFTILLEPYDPNLVYFQDSRKYVFHYSFATEVLDPFRGMTTQQFNAISLFRANQKAILGTVILPPAVVWPTEPQFREYGIQFVRQDPFTPEEIRDLFQLVQSKIAAPPDVEAFYFPTFEQQAVASAHKDWFQAQGIPLGSTARWAEGNTCYSQGWAFGPVKFFPGDRIASAYHSGALRPGDILLTDGVPAEVPFVAGIISLAPSTPNSHVAILARTYGVPFVHLVLAEDAQYAQEIVGRRALLTAYDRADGTCEVKLIDTETLVDDATAAEVLQLKKPTPLNIAPMASLGVFGVSTEGLSPADIRYVGGKASNFGILHRAVPDNSPRAVALTFDLWNAFLDQPLTPAPAIRLPSGGHLLFWADDDAEQGPTHTNFRLSKDGEWLGLFDVDGATLLDSVQFGPQTSDVSYGRSVDGGDAWQFLPAPTPGQPNFAGAAGSGFGLLLNEIMADNKRTIRDPCESDEYPDWIELYNAAPEAIALNSMYLSDDPNEPAKWQVPPEVVAPTLREEIARRLAPYTSYPPDMQMLARDLASIRSLFTNAGVTAFSDELREAVLDVLTDPQYDLDPDAMLRFRSSTNVEDSADFIGAGLYDSYSGCLADALDADDNGPCACDPNRRTERDLFQAIRQVFAGFYNDNAYLERLRHDVDEDQVGMAVVVHHSFPDEIELANGVATVERTGLDAGAEITLVTQQGAVSVTNPADGSIPEEVTATIYPSGDHVPPKLKQASSLTRLGETVMTWNSDYTSLIDLLIRVCDEFAQTTGKTKFTLDLEYKKVAPGSRVLPEGGLVVKQVRQIPASEDTQTAFLINQPTAYEVYAGEVVLDASNTSVDVFANHRLKSRWKLRTRSTVLDSNALRASLYTDVEIEYLDEDRIRTISGQLPLLPSAAHSFQASETTDSWQLNFLENPRTCHLQTLDIPTAIGPGQRPILTLSDLGRSGYNVPFKFLTLHVAYAQDVTSWVLTQTRTTRNDTVHLWPCRPAGSDDIPQERTVSSNGVTIVSRFFYPPLPNGLTAWELGGANTAPLKRWEQTTITGLTTEPIVLKGYYSQTFRPEHHNLVEHFLFEPRLEPGLSDATLAQLRDRNIRFIHMIVDKDRVGADTSRIQTYTFDGRRN